MTAIQNQQTIVDRLCQKKQDLEDQVKKLIAGEVTQYDLQAKLDLQLKTQAELFRLSQRVHQRHDETVIAAIVAELLVESFDFEKALVCLRDLDTGLLHLAGIEGYYDERQRNLALETATEWIAEEAQGDETIKIGSRPFVGMDEWVMVTCMSSLGELLGYALFGNSHEQSSYYRQIDPRDRSLWQAIAGLTSTAIENARLYNQLDRERASLQNARDKLRQLNERLEKTVLERTRELMESESKFRELYFESQRTGRMYRTLLDASPDPIMVYDVHWRPVYLNPAFTRVFGWTLEEFKAQKVEFIPPENQPEALDMIEIILHGRNFSGKESRRFTADGRVVEVSISGAAYMDEQGNVAGSLVQLRDITERKKMEEELLNVRKLESIGLLAGGIAHDFNNILAGIMMNAQLARMKPSKTDKYLAGIEEAAAKAVELTQQLLTFSKGGAPVLKTASIRQLIEESAGFVLRGSNVKCDFNFPDGLWSVEVDKGQMNQVISNLVINGAQSMPDGGVIAIRGENVTIPSESERIGMPLAKGRYVKISFEDHGIGIPRHYLTKIFDPYFTTKQYGSGLGLTTTFSIVTKHNGYVTAESELGRGSIFHVYLPASQKSAPPAPAQSDSDELSVGQAKILIMDDEQVVRDLAAELLTAVGCQVQTAPDGKEALELYCKSLCNGGRFDVVIMDLTVPGGMGGKETMKKLLEIDKDVRAIVSSGYSHDPIMADFKKHGFVGVVAKPYKAPQLVAELRRVLRGSTTE